MRKVSHLTNIEPPSSSTASPRRRRRLSPDEQRKIARLYADSSTPTAEIRDRFGIGESSLYRVLQRYAVPLRGRSASQAEASSDARASAPVRGRPRRVLARGGSPSPRMRVSSKAAATPNAALHRFRVQFAADRIIDAVDISHALRQAEALGATDILAVARAD
jgi:transposase-like protein